MTTALKIVKYKKLPASENMHPLDMISHAQSKVSTLVGLFSTDVFTLMDSSGMTGIYFMLLDIEKELKTGIKALD